MSSSKKFPVELRCPLSHCDFYIKIRAETTWSKVQRAFCQHLLENHTPQQLVEYIYLVVSARAAN